MSEDTTPYSIFIEVVAFERPSTRWRILTGEIIAAYAEANQLMGSTKGRMDPGDWSDQAVIMEKSLDLYRSAWKEFSRRLDSEGFDSASEFGPQVTSAFSEAAEGFKQVCETLRAFVASVG